MGERRYGCVARCRRLPGPLSSNPGSLIVVGSDLFFVATGSVVGTQLWLLPHAGHLRQRRRRPGRGVRFRNPRRQRGCDPACNLPTCGNGFVSTGEQCDDGNTDDTDACTHTCTLNVCGDGAVSRLFEQCDDGNTISGDGCNADCALTCAGDCRGDGRVTVDDLITGVTIALGIARPTDCLAFDTNHDGQVAVDELMTAVNHALNGCATL